MKIPDTGGWMEGFFSSYGSDVWMMAGGCSMMYENIYYVNLQNAEGNSDNQNVQKISQNIYFDATNYHGQNI